MDLGFLIILVIAILLSPLVYKFIQVIAVRKPNPLNACLYFAAVTLQIQHWIISNMWGLTTKADYVTQLDRILENKSKSKRTQVEFVISAFIILVVVAAITYSVVFFVGMEF